MEDLKEAAIDILKNIGAVGGKELIKSIVGDFWVRLKNLVSAQKKEDEHYTSLESEIDAIGDALLQELQNNNNFRSELSQELERIKSAKGYREVISVRGNKNIVIHGTISGSSITIGKSTPENKE